MPFSTTAKNAMLDGATFNAIRLHSGAPGASGTDNALGSGTSAATFATASGGARALSTGVTVASLTPSQSVTHFSVWNSATFMGSGTISSGDVAANASGEYTLQTGTQLQLNDS